MSWQDDLMAKAKLRSAANNGQIDSVSELDNADMAAVAPSLGLPAVNPTSIPLEQGLSNKELGTETYNNLAQQEANDPSYAESNISRAPAVVGGISRSPASPKSETGIEGGEPVQESQTSRLEKMIAELNANRKREMEDASSKELRGNLLNALGSNIGNLVGGAQAMNTGAAVTPPKTEGLKLQDYTGNVERKFKPEHEQLMAQYKALKDANQPMTEYQRQMLAGMAEQRGLQARGLDLRDSQFDKSEVRRVDQLQLSKDKASELAPAQVKTLTALVDARTEVDGLIGQAKKVKLGILATPMNKVKNAFGKAPEFGELERNYAGVRNTIRNALFGSALTQTEKEEFDKELNEISFSDERFDQNLKSYMDKLDRKISATAGTISKTQPLKADNINKLINKNNKPQADVTLGPTSASETVLIQGPSGGAPVRVKADQAAKYLAKPGYKRVD